MANAPDEKKQQKSTERKIEHDILERDADMEAEKAGKAEQAYDREHGEFTK